MAEKIDAEAPQFGQMLQHYRESAKVTQQEIADATETEWINLNRLYLICILERE